MRLLVTAFQASPSRGSEYSVGWGWLRLLVEKHDVTVITNDASRAEIEAFLGGLGPSRRRARFCYVPWSQKWIHSPLWPLIRIFQYSRWRRRALEVAMDVTASEAYDACHHVNAVGFRDVVPLWETGLPFVWGPVGGAVFAPRSLLPALRPASATFFAVKNLANWFALKFSRRPRRAAAQARAIIAATPETHSWIKRSWKADAVVVPEVGLPGVIAGSVSQRVSSEPLRIVWCGRLVEGKVLNILLRAMTQVPADVDWRIDVVGDGPKRRCWEALSESQGLGQRVDFRGGVPRDAALEIMRGGHLFVMTSIYDLTTNVLCEAMAAGLPVVCIAHQAAAKYVGDAAGIVVPVGRLRDVERDIAQAITRLSRDEAERYGMACKALAVAQQFSWDRKREVLGRIYDSIQSGCAPQIR